MRDVIYDLHPTVSFSYFTFVLAFSMYFTHPVTLGVSLSGAISYAVYLKGDKAVRFGWRFMLPMIIIVSLMNPLFNHQGATILTYLRDGNPLTLESIAYGVASGCMLITVICWFSCFHVVVTSDKIMYLFGRVIPAMSLLLSMTLRFVPRFKRQMLAVADAQQGVGRDVLRGGILKRAKHGVHILSIMVTWALENAIETADSMKSRGYGLRGRTAFFNFRFDKRDQYILLFIMACGMTVIIAACFGGLEFQYYPTMRGDLVVPASMIAYIAHGALCLMPVILNVRENQKWKALRSAA